MFSDKFEDWEKVLEWGVQINAFKEKLNDIPWNKSPLARHSKYVEVLKTLELGWNVKREFPVYDSLEECLAETIVAGKEYSLQTLYNSLTNKPKLSSTLDSLEEVQAHFETHKCTAQYLDLYRRTLKCEPWQVLCFLLGIHLGASSEFTEIPSALLCKARGYPYRPNEQFDLRTSSRPAKMIAKPTSFLLCTDTEVHLYVKDDKVASHKCTGYPVVIPTTSSKKQRVIMLNGTSCRVLSITTEAITEIGEFDIEADGQIMFMDAFTTKKSDGTDQTVLQWGGGDCIRGVVNWSYCTGLNESLQFFEVDDFNNTYRALSLKNKQDFSLHGNLLTLRQDSVEAEEDGKRSWKINQLLVCEKTSVLGSSFSGHIDDVWGSPHQHLLLSENTVYTIECGFIRNEAEVVSGGLYVCGLQALSRLSAKKVLS
jgi:hypothetical protein